MKLSRGQGCYVAVIITAVYALAVYGLVQLLQEWRP